MVDEVGRQVETEIAEPASVTAAGPSGTGQRHLGADVRPVIRVAEVDTVYRGVVGILEPKLLALDACEDLEVTAITAPPPLYPPLPAPNLRHIAFPIVRPIRPWADLRSIIELYWILRREKFDIVHTHSAKSGFVGAIAAWLARVPVIVHTYRGMPFFDGQPRLSYYTYRALEWLACRFRHAAFSQNRRELVSCVKLLGAPDRAFFEGNGVDVRAVRAAAERDRHLAEAEFPPAALRLTLLSRLEPVKRVSDFLASCELLARSGLDFAAVIAGYGWLEQQTRKEIVDRGLNGRVRLVGWAPHGVALLASSDIVVLTSEKEGVPRSLMEAMALGRPVVATDVVGTQELVVDGETGFLVPLGQPHELAARITLLAGDPALRHRLGKAGMARVEAEFDDIRIAAFLRKKYLEFYRARVTGVRSRLRVSSHQEVGIVPSHIVDRKGSMKWRDKSPPAEGGGL